jgi:hypothetical protein
LEPELFIASVARWQNDPLENPEPDPPDPEFDPEFDPDPEEPLFEEFALLLPPPPHAASRNSAASTPITTLRMGSPPVEVPIVERLARN